MPAPITHRRITVDEYHGMAEAGLLHEDARVELLDGQIVAMTPIGRRHAATVARLTRLFSEHAAERAIVWVQNPIVVSRYWEPQPDLCLLRPRDDFYARAHPRAEDVLLVIEVADTSGGDDRERKLPEYGRAGIPEGWLVDLERDAIEMCRAPGHEGYGNVRILKRGDELTPLHLASVLIPMEDVLGANPP